ncbi:MAG: hypothetical protein ACREUG_05920, partial [Steroidobacteraceae bacterium]
LQYRVRGTALARGLIACGGAFVILSAFVPWHLAFAIQEKLAPEPLAARDIALALDPQAGPFRVPPGGVPPRSNVGAPRADAPAPDAGAGSPLGTTIYLPLRVTGIPASSGVLMDRAEIRVRDADGRTLYAGRTNLSVDGFGSIEDARFEARPGPANRGALERRSAGSAAARVYERVFLPAAVLARVGSRPVDLDIDYSLTLFRPGATYSLPAVAGHLTMGGTGSCTTGIDGEGDDVWIRCIGAGAQPACFTAYLEYEPSGLRNPETHYCEPDYSPVHGALWLDALSRATGELPFFDRSGLTRYPIDGTKLGESRLVVETYAPRDHFTRHLSIRGVRLADFAAAASPTATARPPG